MFLNARQLKFSLKNEVNIEKFKTLFLSTFSRALRELVISTQHLYYSEIQSSETFLPAGLIIHLQQQPISLFRLTTSDLFQLSTVLQREIAGKSYLFSSTSLESRPIFTIGVSEDSQELDLQLF